MGTHGVVETPNEVGQSNAKYFVCVQDDNPYFITFCHHYKCVICMMEFLVGDNVRYLPCMHIYHVHCIDDWLMRSFTCPSCMEPVDAALLTSYETS